MTEAKRFEDFGVVRKIRDAHVGVRDVQWPHHVENEVLFDSEIIVGQPHSTVQQENHISFYFAGWNDRFNGIQQNIDSQIPSHRNLFQIPQRVVHTNAIYLLQLICCMRFNCHFRNPAPYEHSHWNPIQSICNYKKSLLQLYCVNGPLLYHYVIPCLCAKPAK